MGVFRMAVDLTKLILHSSYPAFKNNRIYTGSLTISGTYSAGTTVKTWNIPLEQPIDIADVSFSGKAPPSYDDRPVRPTSAWFKKGFIGTPDNYPSPLPNFANWMITWRLTSPTNIQIRAEYVAQYTGTWTVTPTTFKYRIIDYSAL